VGIKGRFAIDMTGLRFNRLVVKERAGVRNGHMHWLVRCDCGVEKVVSGSAVRRGHQKSCGCMIRTHGMSRSVTYKSWQSMWSRCTNTASLNYRRYGAVGVTVCDRWDSFENFLEDMGERQPGMSLDRLDTFGNYEPNNCRWATRAQQDANTRRSLRFLTIDDEPISVNQIAHILAMNPGAMYGRLTVRLQRLSLMRLER
jgi:hypothetical protein